MNLTQFDPESVAGTRACIVDPQSPYDDALAALYSWYHGFFVKHLDPPLPQQLLANFRALTDSDEDYAEAVEIAIHLAHDDAQSPTGTSMALSLILAAAKLIR